MIETITGEVRSNIDAHGIELVRGDARLGLDRTVHVMTAKGETRDLQADAILVATGSRPFHPPGIDFDDPDVVDSATVLDLDQPVRRLVIIGGGAVGCEYASIFRALASEVTLVDERSRLIPTMDHDICDGLADALRDIGVQVKLGAGRVQVRRDREGLIVEIPGHGIVRADKLLFAAGRVGNIEGLALDEIGVVVEERGRINVDDCYRTSAPEIYAAGDVIGPPALASVSMEQGRVAACHAFGIPFKQMVDPITPIGVYSIPEAAAAGRVRCSVRLAEISPMRANLAVLDLVRLS